MFLHLYTLHLPLSLSLSSSMQTVAVATSILLELLQARAVQDANDTRQQVRPPVVVWYIKDFHGNTHQW